MNSPLLEKSLDFATQFVLFYAEEIKRMLIASLNTTKENVK